MSDNAPEEEEAGGIPEWVVTFGDMMSLLLTFFIMLFSMAEIKQEETYQAMVEALRQRFGHDMTIVAPSPGPVRPRNSPMAQLASMGRARRANTMNGGDKVKAPVGDHPKVRTAPNGKDTTVGGFIYFERNSAELTEQHKKELQSTAERFYGKPNRIEVRGHTSMYPLGDDSPFKSHRELSYRRAENVANYLETLKIAPERLRITAAGDTEPQSNDYLQMHLNDCVVVTMLSELISMARDRDGEGD